MSESGPNPEGREPARPAPRAVQPWEYETSYIATLYQIRLPRDLLLRLEGWALRVGKKPSALILEILEEAARARRQS